MKINESKYGFVVKKRAEVSELNATMYEMEHIKTHLKLAWLKRDEENKTFGIAFKTLPSDDSGVFHILEHSVLCGSKKYPVKEPFVELMKSSMSTFLNALTFEDKTFYPISSRNNQDFMNLTKVYLDAVFNPLILNKKEIFLQEGWHIEATEKPTYKGVVLNEMKGAFSSPREIMMNALNRALFKDNCYQYVSGGDPEAITGLTYEQFIQTYQKYYHPSNAFVFLDGDVPLDDVLELLNQEYLSSMEANLPIEGPIYQQPVQVSRRVVDYEIGEEENAENKYRMAWGNVIGSYQDYEKVIAMQVLSDVLCGDNQAVLNKVLLEKGLAENVYLAINDGELQNWCQLEVDHIKEENLDQVKEIVFDTLQTLIKEGIDRQQLEATLAYLELNLKERNFGGYPQGIIFGFQVLESWLYGGKPEAHLEYGKIFDDLKKKVNEGYFENLIKEVLLENNHSCEIVLKPSKELGKIRREKEEKTLTKVLNSMTDVQKQQLQIEQKQLDAFQQAPDTLENLNTLPKLNLEDIEAKVQKIPSKLMDLEGCKVLKHPTETNGIYYYALYFNIDHLDLNQISTLSFICSLLGNVSTIKHSAKDLSTKIRLLCGTMNYSINTYEKTNKENQVYFKATFSTLEENEQEALQLLVEILQESVFDQEKMIRDILKQRIISLKQAITMSGHSLSMKRVLAMVSSSGVIDEYSSGIAYYKWLKELDDHFDFVALKQKLESVYQNVCFYNRLTLSFTGNDDTNLEKQVLYLKETLKISDALEKAIIKPFSIKKEGIIIPSDIAYASKGGYLLETSKITPLASNIISLAYLWNVVRVQGGAYGTGLVSRASGFTCCYSYRDPNGKESLKKYEKCGTFLKDYLKENHDLTGFIIGTLSGLMPLMMPYNIGKYGDLYYFNQKDEKARQEQLEAILNVDKDELLEIAKAIDETLEKGGICIIGGKNQIDQCDLDEVISL